MADETPNETPEDDAYDIPEPEAPFHEAPKGAAGDEPAQSSPALPADSKVEAKEEPKVEAKPEPKPEPKPAPAPELEWALPWEAMLTDEDYKDQEEEYEKHVGKQLGKVVDPSVKKVVTEIHNHYKGELAKHRQVLEQLWEERQQRRAEEGMAKLDAFVAEVSDTYPEFDFKPSKIKDDSVEYKRLAAFMRSMEVLADDYKQKGKPIPSNESLRDELLEVNYGKREKAEKKEQKDRPRDKETGQFRPTPTAKPTQRNGTAPKGMSREQQGINELHEKLVARGLVADAANDQLEDLPDSLLG